MVRGGDGQIKDGDGAGVLPIWPPQTFDYEHVRIAHTHHEASFSGRVLHRNLQRLVKFQQRSLEDLKPLFQPSSQTDVHVNFDRHLFAAILSAAYPIGSPKSIRSFVPSQTLISELKPKTEPQIGRLRK